MLFNLLAPFADDFHVFNLFRYLTFRTGGAMMTALFLSVLFGPWIINWRKSRQGAGQPIRTDGPETHLAKAGTPTMGGFLILLALCLTTLLWADLKNAYVWIVILFVAVAFVEMVGVLNGANLANGLVVVLVMVTAGCLGFLAFLVGNAVFADRLQIPFVPGIGELSVFCGAVIGAGLGLRQQTAAGGGG